MCEFYFHLLILETVTFDLFVFYYVVFYFWFSKPTITATKQSFSF